MEFSIREFNEPFWVWVFDSPNELFTLFKIFGPIVWLFLSGKKLIPILFTGVWYWYWFT